MSDKRISYTVQGQVQGVNFRAFTTREAQHLGLTGYVTNAANGTVQGEAQGSEHAINQFVQHLNKGPPAASVSKVSQSDVSAKSGESGFNVR